MEAGSDELFSSPADVSNSMPYKLLWSIPKSWDELWIFWNRQNSGPQTILNSLLPGVDTSSSGNGTITEKIKAVLQSVQCPSDYDGLIQFWAPVRTTEDKNYLTTADQPFGLTKLYKELCSYRRLGVWTTLIGPINVNEMDDEEEHNPGPLARVFRQGVREFCNNVRYYHRKEYLHRDYVVNNLGVKSYCALPILESLGQHCIGVLEILSTSESSFDNLMNSLEYQLENVDLTCDKPSAFTDNPEDSEGSKAACKVLMVDMCNRHLLPFAQMWAASSTTRRVDRIFCFKPEPTGRTFNRESSGECRVWEGKGIVGKTFSSRSACFCNNISELNISVYPSVLNARKLGLAQCFAVCLQSTHADDEFYILEFSLPRRDRDPRNFVKMLVATLKEKIQSSMGAHVRKLGEKLFVEVIKVSSHDKLDSFEICDAVTTRSALGKRNGFGNDLRPRNHPFSVREGGLGSALALGPPTGIQSHAEVGSNSLQLGQEDPLDLHLGLPAFGGVQNAVVQPNPKPEAEGDTTSHIRNYSVGRRRPPTPSSSLPNTDPDANAFKQILKHATAREGVLPFDLNSNSDINCEF